MKEVLDAVRGAAMRRFEGFAEQRLPDMPLFKQVGMQMVLFGAREPKLYQLLFMQENRTAVSFDDIFGELGPTAETCIGLIQETYDMCETEARLLFEKRLDLHLRRRHAVRDAEVPVLRRSTRPDALHRISGHDAADKDAAGNGRTIDNARRKDAERNPIKLGSLCVFFRSD